MVYCPALDSQSIAPLIEEFSSKTVYFQNLEFVGDPIFRQNVILIARVERNVWK